MPGIRIIALATLSLVVAFLSLAPLPAHAGLVFTVNSTGDGSDTNPGDGQCEVVPPFVFSPRPVLGVCTLRAAIEEANASPGHDTIAFEIPGAGCVDFAEICEPTEEPEFGWRTIAPGSQLPGITDPVTIDGTTQPGFAGTPIIELNGENAGGDVSGLVISSGSSIVRGLVINRFDGVGIWLNSIGGNAVEGNFVGTDVGGSLGLGNNTGILVDESGSNLIGGLTSTSRNIISGNTTGGLTFRESNSNHIAGNYVGTDVTGELDLGEPLWESVSIISQATTLSGA